MICNKIQALEYPSGITADLLVSGALFLDTDDDFGIRQTRRAEELNSVNKITVSASLGISLPHTPKNFMVLGKYINPNVHDFDFKPLRVIAYSASNVITQSLLYVLSHDEKTGFSCELRDDESHWIVGSKKVLLKDLEFDPFQLTRANIEANFALNEFAPGDPGIYFPLAYYGGWKEGSFATVPDMRPWFHVINILKKGFAAIGWIFKSPIFDLSIGKKMISYLIQPFDINQAQTERPNTFWAAKTTDDQYLTPAPNTIILYDSESYDANNVYDPGTGKFSADGNYDFHFSIYLKGLPNAQYFGELYNVRIVKQSGAVRKILYTGTGEPGFLGTELTYTDADEWIIEGYALRVQVSANDQVFIEIDLPGIGERIVGGTFYNLNNIWVLIENEYFDPATLISKDHRLYDFFRGIVHLFQGKIHTDFNTHELTLYPNYKTKWFDNEIDGYYLDQTVDLTTFQRLDSSKVSSVNVDNKRYIRLQFKQSTDNRIIGLNYPQDKPIFSKQVDLGDHFDNEVEVLENPFFEPTVNDKVFSIRPSVIDPAKEYYIDMPFLVDNDEGFPSFKIAPRIIIAHGDTTYKGSTGQEIYWRWYETTRTTLPYGSQLPNLKDAAGEILKEALIYGEQVNDLYSRFWKAWIFDNFVNTKVNALFLLNPSQFHSLNLRKAYHFWSNGKSVYGRIQAINDFDGCGRTDTPIDLIPSTGNLSAPVVEEPTEPEFCAGQNPVLLVAETVPGTWNGSYQDTYVTDTGVSYLIEWRYFDVGTWTTGTDVVNPTKPFYFRLKVVLENCGTIYRLAYIDPCGGNLPVIVWSLVHLDPADDTKWCITASIGGILNQAINSSSFQKEIDGGAATAYTIDNEICGITGEVRVFGEIQFDNDCPAVPIEGTYLFPPVQVNCDDNQPTVEAIHEGLGMFTFQKAGTWVSRLSVYFIQYRQPGQGDNDWIIWDHHAPVPLPAPIEARGVFFWCDTCPPVCTEVVDGIDPEALLGMVSDELKSKSAMNFSWDWSKISASDGQPYSGPIIDQFIQAWEESDGAKAGALHNKNHLSDYFYCCGDDPTSALKHISYAVSNGIIQATKPI